jgi:hypothetical protein
MMFRRLSPAFAGRVTALWLVAGVDCGPVAYSLEVREAERVVDAARSENASYYAAYDLYFAEAQLDKAHEEAACSEYEDAIHAAMLALQHGRRALTRSAHPGLSDR